MNHDAICSNQGVCIYRGDLLSLSKKILSEMGLLGRLCSRLKNFLKNSTFEGDFLFIFKIGCLGLFGFQIKWWLYGAPL